jgi:hypothetical protein
LNNPVTARLAVATSTLWHLSRRGPCEGGSRNEAKTQKDRSLSLLPNGYSIYDNAQGYQFAHIELPRKDEASDFLLNREIRGAVLFIHTN